MTVESTLLSSTRDIFSKIEHKLDHKIRLANLKIEVFSDQCMVKMRNQ